jgi:hypothetical protein
MERDYQDSVVACGFTHDWISNVEPDAGKAAHYRQLKKGYERAVHFPWNWLARRQPGLDSQLRLLGAELGILIRETKAWETTHGNKAPMNLEYFDYGADDRTSESR